MAANDFRDGLRLLRQTDVGRLLIAYLLTHTGTAMARLGIVAAGFLFEVIVYRSTLLIAAGMVILPSAAAFSVRAVRMMTSSD